MNPNFWIASRNSSDSILVCNPLKQNTAQNSLCRVLVNYILIVQKTWSQKQFSAAFHIIPNLQKQHLHPYLQIEEYAMLSSNEGKLIAPLVNVKNKHIIEFEFCLKTKLHYHEQYSVI